MDDQRNHEQDKEISKLHAYRGEDRATLQNHGQRIGNLERYMDALRDRDWFSMVEDRIQKHKDTCEAGSGKMEVRGDKSKEFRILIAANIVQIGVLITMIATILIGGA